jgi:hypothetical protein
MTTSINAKPAIDLTLDGFINAIFHDRDAVTEEVCLAQAPMDDAAPWQQRAWRAGTNHSDMTHVCISTVKPRPGETQLKRRAGDLVRAHFVMLDDVGTKVRPEMVACDPSWVLETSPGNHQYGFIFSQPVEPARASALAKIAARADLTDMKSTDANRVARVPGSIKPGKGYAAKLVEWRPERTYTLEELAAQLGLDQEAIEAAVRSPGSTTDSSLTPTELARYRVTDPVLAGFDALNMIDGSITNGYVIVECPWADLHSKQDKTTGYAPKAQHFSCFHSDGAIDAEGKKTRADVVEWLAEQLGEDAWREIKRQALAERLKDAPLPEGTDAEDYLPPSKTEAEAIERRVAAEVEATPPREWEVFDKNRKRRAIPKRRAMMSFLQRGVVTQLFSPSNMGKSQFTLAVAYALAFERHDIIGEEKPFQLPGSTFYICNEDDAAEFERRTDALLQVNDLDYDALKHAVRVNKTTGFKVVHRRDKYSPVEITPDMMRLAEQIRAAGDVALVTVDTQASSFSGLCENDADDMSAAFTLLDAWCKSLDVALMLVHHTTKSAAQNDLVGHETSRGSGAAGASTRYTVQLVAPTAGEMAKLPPEERHSWFGLVLTKTAYGAKDGSRRWFRKTGKTVMTEDFDGSIATSDKWDSAGACIYDAKGPQLEADVSDKDLLMNALLAVWDADNKGEPLFTSEKGNSPRRGCVVVGNAVSKPGLRGTRNADGAKFLVELERLELVEREVLKTGDRNDVEVWRPTPKGAEMATDRSANALGAGPADEIEVEPTPALAVVAPAVVTPLKPKARSCKTPRAPKTPAATKAPAPAESLGEIDFGTAAPLAAEVAD